MPGTTAERCAFVGMARLGSRELVLRLARGNRVQPRRVTRVAGLASVLPHASLAWAMPTYANVSFTTPLKSLGQIRRLMDIPQPGATNPV